MIAPDPCAAFDAALPDWLEGTLPPAARAAADAHLATCASCAARVASLDHPLPAARDLPAVLPTRDLWPGIDARIGPRVLALPTTADQRAAPAPWRRWAAAAALVAVSVGGTYLALRTRDTAASTGDLAATTSAGVTTVQRASGRETLAAEVQQLERALAERAPALEPTTAAAIRRSLAIIDRAIADARAALATDSANVLLDQQLTRVLGKKAELMRRAAMLPART